MVLGNNFNGCLLTGDIVDRLDFTEVKNNLLNIYKSYKINCGLKCCVLYSKDQDNNYKNNKALNEFFLWGRFSNEEYENIDLEQFCFPFSYKNFPMKNKISRISCGDTHLLIVDSTGMLFSLGKGEHGELGLGENMLTLNTPSRIITFEEKENKSFETYKFISCFAAMKGSYAIAGFL